MFGPRVDREAFWRAQRWIGIRLAMLYQWHSGAEGWGDEWLVWEYLRHGLGKERLAESARELIDRIEPLPGTRRDSIRFGGGSLLERCYIIVSNYEVAEGIHRAMLERSGDEWKALRARRLGRSHLEAIPAENDAYVSLLQGFLRAGIGESEPALEEFRQAADRLPTHPSPLYAIGNQLLSMGDDAGGEAALRHALAVRKSYRGIGILPVEDEIFYYLRIAMACVRQERYGQAVEILREAVAERLPMRPEQGAALYRCLGLCHKSLGDRRRSAFCLAESDRLEREAATNLRSSPMSSSRPSDRLPKDISPDVSASGR